MPECKVIFYVLGMHKFVVPHMKLTTFFWLSWEQCICHPCSFYAGCLLACYMLHFNGKNLISERSLKLVPLHTTIPSYQGHHQWKSMIKIMSRTANRHSNTPLAKENMILRIQNWHFKKTNHGKTRFFKVRICFHVLAATE